VALRELIRSTPWWARVVTVFAASRVLTTGLLLWFASRQEANPWTIAQPGYVDFARMWDAHWYYIIAVVGYPTELPVTADGHVGESAWAFMPAYPFLVRGLMLGGTEYFAEVGIAVSVVFALGTCLLLYRLFERSLGAGSALFAVVLFCVAPLSPIYQIAYAESMHAFLLTLALLLLVERRYLTLLPVIALMALTRPSGLAFALAMLLHLGYRWWRRGTEAFPPREIGRVIVVGLFSFVMGLAWLLIAAATTGSLTAYTDTELAWRSGYIGYGELVPFAAWIQGAEFWLRFPEGPWIVAAGLVFLVGLFVVLVRARRLPVDLRFWSASYMIYLLAVFFPQSSTFRLLIPLFPALGALAIPSSRIYRVVLVLLFIAGQVAWLQACWLVDGADWTVP